MDTKWQGGRTAVPRDIERADCDKPMSAEEGVKPPEGRVVRGTKGAGPAQGNERWLVPKAQSSQPLASSPCQSRCGKG